MCNEDNTRLEAKLGRLAKAKPKEGECVPTAMLLGFAIIMVLTTTSSAQQKDAQNELLYAAKDSGRIDVYDIARHRVFGEGREYLARRDGHHYGEFAGQFVDCGTSVYHCIRGGFYAVVPKRISGQQQWSLQGIQCRSVGPLASKSVITCVYRKGSTTFLYQTDRGVLAYQNSENPELQFELVGERGLFSRE